MAKTCNNCGAENMNVSVPYVVHESAMARCERHSKRLWVVVLVLIGALIFSNLAWIIYNSQFEVVEETTETSIAQENDSGDNNYIGSNGDITYGETENHD